MKRHRLQFLSALLLLIAFSGCQPETPSVKQPKSAQTSPVIVVVNYPLQFIVESLVGPEFEVLNPVPPGANPETWLPDDVETETIQRAVLIVTNGANFADWVKKLSLPRSKVLRTSLSLKDALITVPDFEVHSHGTDGAHSHAGTVAFFWLDPALMERQAEAIAQRLIQLEPSQKEAMTANLEKLQKSLQPLGQQLDQLQAQYPGLHWLSGRPLYQYLARRCDWTVHHLHWKNDAVPSDADWEQFNLVQQKHPGSLTLWEKQPNDAVTAQLKARGVAWFVLDPLTVKPVQGDYLSEMKRQLTELEQFLKTQQTEKAESGKNAKDKTGRF